MVKFLKKHLNIITTIILFVLLLFDTDFHSVGKLRIFTLCREAAVTALNVIEYLARYTKK